MKMEFWMDDLMEEIGKCLVQNHEKRIDPFMDEIRCVQMNYWLVWMDAHSR
jgi:hypothetical protein